MKKNELSKWQYILLFIFIEVVIIILLTCANLWVNFYFIFYNIGYGLILSTIFSLYYVCRKNETLSSLGICTFGKRQVIIVIIFVLFSIGGQFIPIITNKTELQWELLKIGFIPLVMTTFFEELLFRGFMQTRMEKLFGFLPAIIISGCMFSLYHIGYPGFRNISDILLLAAVGIGFSIAFKLSQNNLLAVYLVNLPNALLTYLLKFSQFPEMDFNSVLWGAVSIGLIILILITGIRKIKKNSS